MNTLDNTSTTALTELPCELTQSSIVSTIDAMASSEIVAPENVSEEDLALLDDSADAHALANRPEPIITKVVLPDGLELTPEEANERTTAEAAKQAQWSDPDGAIRCYFDDEGFENGVLRIHSKGYRPESIWFGELAEDIADAAMSMPSTIGEIVGVTEDEIRSNVDNFDAYFEDVLKSQPTAKQMEVKNYLAGLYFKIRQQPGIIRRWTFASKGGEVREITQDTIEKLPKPIKQAIAQYIVATEITGKTEHDFFLS